MTAKETLDNDQRLRKKKIEHMATPCELSHSLRSLILIYTSVTWQTALNE